MNDTQASQHLATHCCKIAIKRIFQAQADLLRNAATCSHAGRSQMVCIHRVCLCFATRVVELEKKMKEFTGIQEDTEE